MINVDNFNANDFFVHSKTDACKVYLVTTENYTDFYNSLNPKLQNHLTQLSFDIADNQSFILPDFDDKGALSVIMPFKKNGYEAILSKLETLPKNIKIVAFDNVPDDFDYQKMAYNWAAHSYRFSYYKNNEKKNIKLYIPELSEAVVNQLRALFLGRNCINFPAEDVTPWVLEQTLKNFALEFKAECRSFVGSELLDNGFNLIHAVGRGIIDEERQPRLIDFHYKTTFKENPKTIVLVGKGVCFDSGGLNIKSESGMLLMKKDMGGAATVLSLALSLLLSKPDFNLRVLIPAVENNVTANSFKPGDIFKAYNGKTVEITNTDAEGRLILGDAMAYVATDNPDLMIDIATLTGAARVALGGDLPALFTNNNDLIPLFMNSEYYSQDPVWQLPLWQGYDDAMHGTITDLINSEAGGMAGSIKAALYLQHFIGDVKNWIHLDSYCYIQKSKPAHPKGGEVMPFKLLLDVIQKFVAL